MMDRAWRAGMTGLAFIVFGVGAVVSTFFLFPLVALVTPARVRRAERIRYLIYRLFGGFVWLIQVLGTCRIDFDDRAKLAACRGTLIVANHPTLIDVVILMSVNPRVQCIVKHQLHRNPFLRGVVRWADFIPNDLDSDELLERCADSIRDGSNLLIFPEGTRTVPGHPITLQRGFANIAIHARAGMQVVLVDCDQPFLCKGYPWYRSPRKRARFKVSVCERWEVSDYPESLQRPLVARRLLENLQALFRQRLAHGVAGGPSDTACIRNTEIHEKIF